MRGTAFFFFTFLLISQGKSGLFRWLLSMGEYNLQQVFKKNQDLTDLNMFCFILD